MWFPVISGALNFRILASYPGLYYKAMRTSTSWGFQKPCRRIILVRFCFLSCFCITNKNALLLHSYKFTRRWATLQSHFCSAIAV